MHPLTVRPSGVPAAAAPSRPDRPRFLGFNPLRSTWRLVEVLTRQALATPLGFTLRGYSGESLGRDFAPPPLTRLANARACARASPAPQSIDRPSPGIFPRRYRSAAWEDATLIGFPHRLAPARSGIRSSGLCVHLASRRALPPTDRRSLDDPDTMPQPPGPV
jgi:hypothetical protein